MCFFFSFLPATFWTTVGFFVLFSSTKLEGRMQTFGRVLGVWTFVVALGFIICGIYMTVSGACPFDLLMGLMESMPR